MKSFLLLISFLFGCNVLQAADLKKETIDFLAHKTIEDFHKGLENYNQKNFPVIKRIGKQNYILVANTTTVRFSLVNYLNDQMYVNAQLTKRSTFGLRKTTYAPSFIANAMASDAAGLNASTTKIILIALGKLDDHLEEVGMMCFGGCEKSTREANLKKIISTLDDDHKICNEQLYADDDSIKKYPSYRMVSLLHSTFNPEFQSVRNFYLKVADANKKSVERFISKKLGINKEHGSCIGVMAAGSVMESGVPSVATVKSTVESAYSVCVKMVELKSCLVNLKKNLSVINSIKRSAKKATRTKYVPEEKLPEIKIITK